MMKTQHTLAVGASQEMSYTQLGEGMINLNKQV